MTVEIKYCPENLDYEAFEQVEIQCFSDEPVDAGKFAEMVTGDFWAVFGGDEFVGYGYVMLKPGFAWIVRVGVSEDWRNQGVGNRLMETMLEHCRKHGRSKIILYVQQDNPSASHLYRKFGFKETEVTHQYVVPIRRFLASHREAPSGSVTAVPVTEVDEALLPSFSEEWEDIASLHHPPDNYVLVFRAGGRHTTGFCRLSPGFPGCFPFVIDGISVDRLKDILISLDRYLDPQKEILKLTFSDEVLADACEQLGFELNYKLFKMEK